ncbi:ras-like protein 3 isoform X2 [Dendronephthya gigantea]|uniref:ras-like protein 3 isoform X2 n=1 Tax=Dendronephthya gigantea TaxID=151771 RepID=UPI00106C99FA|nr:ras-like protein 3 isoform X2 [Dendronephthya gigantea]
MHRRRGSAPAVILQQHLSKYNNWEKNGFHSEDGKKDKEKLKVKKSAKCDLSRSSSPMFHQMGKLSEEGRSKQQTSSDPSINNLVCGNGNNNHHFISKRPSSPTLITSERKNDKCSGKRLTIRGQDWCSTEITNTTRQNLKKAGSIKDYHIVLLGQGGVGKSEMNYEMLAEIDDEIGDLHILDTANTTEPVYLNEGQGFIVIYSINDRLSFETAKQLVKLIREVKKAKGSSIVLVGNKVDLKYDRVVPRNEGRNFAVEYECTFYETSAMNNINVPVIFHDLVKQMRVISKKNGRMNSLKNFFAR